MTYLEYIYSNASLIGVNHPSFQIHQLYQKKRKAIEDINNPTFVSLCHELWEKDINRQFVKEAVRKGLYRGFVTTMLWGGQGLGPGNSWNNIINSMSCPKNEIETKLKGVQLLLKKNKLSQAFVSMNSRGDYKIPGVGMSYFTKLLFYLGLNIKESKEYPLIFDKWGQYIHAALLIDDEKEDVLSWYRIYTDKHDNFNVIARKELDAYLDYISRIRSLSIELKINHPGDLEEYLFGRDLKPQSNKTNTNPRFFVREYVRTYYNTTIMGAASNHQSQNITSSRAKANNNRRKKHNTELKVSVHPIPAGKIIKGRTVDFGYEFDYDGRSYYLMAGKKKTFAYCELLSKGNNDINSFARIQDLAQRGFNKKNSNYIYKKYRLEETPLAIAEVDSLLKEWGLK